MPKLLLLATLCIAGAALPVLGQESPLTVVMDGREAARTSALTEEGMKTVAQGGANIILSVCGALAVVLTMLGLIELHRASDGDVMMGGQQATKRGAVWKLVIAGLIMIPAVVAAILPYAVL